MSLIQRLSEDPEIVFLKNLFAEVLLLTKEDLQNPVPRGCYDGRNEPWRIKMEALSFVRSRYCQLICDFLGIDYERYKKRGVEELQTVKN